MKDKKVVEMEYVITEKSLEDKFDKLIDALKCIGQVMVLILIELALISGALFFHMVFSHI